MWRFVPKKASSHLVSQKMACLGASYRGPSSAAELAFPPKQGSLHDATHEKMEFNFTGIPSKQNNVFNIPAV